MKNLMSAEAKQIDLVDYLSALGQRPQKVRNNDYWYLSPLRTENTPSFKVNRTRNVWYDHGIGKGGNLIDFGIIYFNCSVAAFVGISKCLNFFFSPALYHLQFASTFFFPCW